MSDRAEHPSGRQLALLAPGTDGGDGPWALDDHTREVGRRGLAAARQALALARVPARPAA